MAALARGSISVGLYRHETGDVHRSWELALGEAAQAEEAGFDGVTFSEHHLGHSDYFPNPLLVAGQVLARTSRVWAGSLPMLLTLRPAAVVAEDAAWLDANYPGRVALGVAAGNVAEEFALGEATDGLVDCFRRRLAALGGYLVSGTDGGLGDDPAIRQARGRIPLVSAARSRTAVERAARLGAGILHSPVSPVERMAELTRHYEDSGGTGRRVLIYAAWLTDSAAPSAPDEHAAAWTTMGCSDQVAERLRDHLVASGADALNIRLHSRDAGPEQVADQLARFGAEVIPMIRPVFDS